jgi:hypothetical protein
MSGGELVFFFTGSFFMYLLYLFLGVRRRTDAILVLSDGVEYDKAGAALTNSPPHC